MKIGLLSAAFPPDADAIGEYTWWLARELAILRHDVTVFTAKGTRESPDPIIKVEPCFDPAEPNGHGGIAAAIAREQPDWLVVQYNPFAYGRRGFCPWVPGLLRQVRTSGTRVAVMFHEVFTSDPGLAASIMRLWQRPQAQATGRSADVVLVSCTAYGEALRCKSWRLLPVGSNLPDAAIADRIAETPVLLGAFGTGHVSHRFDLMAEALRRVLAQGVAAEFVFIGSGGARAAAYFDGLPFRATGPVTAEEASQLIASLDVVLAPFTDGLSTRRGSVAAALQCGRTVVSTIGENTDPALRAESGKAFLLAETDEAFIAEVAALCLDPERRHTLGRGARAYFDARLAWPRIAAELLAALPPDH